MKNTFVKALLVFLLALSLIGLASCKNDSETNNDTQPQTSHTHAFGEWKLVKEATLNEEGAEERTCSCGEVETRTVATTPSSVGLKYAVNPDGETCTIRGIGTCTDTKIIIGQTIDGYRASFVGVAGVGMLPALWAEAENSSFSSTSAAHTVRTASVILEPAAI